MKKIILIVSEKSRNNFLHALRGAGVVHVKNVSLPTSEEISALEKDISGLNKAGDMLYSHYPAETRQIKELTGEEAVRCAGEVIQKYEEKEELLRKMHDISLQIEWFKLWGEFNPHDVRELEKESITIKLYRLTKSQFRHLQARHEERVFAVGRDRDYVYLAFVAYYPTEGLQYDEIMPPRHSLNELHDELSSSKERLRSIEFFLREKAGFTHSLKKNKLQLERKLEFLNVRYGMKDEKAFAYLEGFCPADELQKIISLAKSEAAGYLIEEPDDPFETPTLIKNPRWLGIIEPVFQFMRTIPGYNEYDVSFPFLVFFSLFFAMLIGDAGYGVIFVLAAYLARRKFKNASPAPFFLIYLLGFSTIIWGALTGTWFGYEKIARLPILNALVIERINSFISGNENFMIYICFVVGATHLTIAHLMTGFRVLNSLAVLAQAGWILVLWSMFFVAGKLILDKPFPDFTVYLLGAGTALILFFTNAQRNFIKGIFITLIDLPLKIISAFADIVSYLRLFAIGYASTIVSGTFNDMALTQGFGSIMSGLGAALILLLGHSLNILLGLMSVLVHGVRLNMLEFSGHLGMEWSGREYKPFK